MKYDQIATIFFQTVQSISFLGTLMVLMVCDIAVGTLAAWINKKISSTTSFRGMGKKVIMLIAVGAGAAIGRESNMPLAQIIAGYYCLTEMWSIIENMAKAGIPFPEKVTAVLEKLNPDAKPLNGVPSLSDTPSVSDPLEE